MTTTTTTHCKASDTEDRWLLFDASEQPLGRMAAMIAKSLMGKDRPTYQPSELCGAHVVVIQAERPRAHGQPRAARKSTRATPAIPAVFTCSPSSA